MEWDKYGYPAQLSVIRYPLSVKRRRLRKTDNSTYLLTRTEGASDQADPRKVWNGQRYREPHHVSDAS